MIAETQKKEENVKLLSAQRQLYTDAKRIGGLKTILVILPVIAAVVLQLVPTVEVDSWTTGVIGLLFGLVSKYSLDIAQKNKVALAAKIQELFDLNVFGLKWHEPVTGAKPAPESLDAAKRFKNEKDKKHWLEDGWYSPPSGGSHSYQVLFCQRSNFVWEWRQRRWFSSILGVVLILLYSIPIILVAYENGSMQQYLSNFLLPTIPLLLLVWDALSAHRRLYQRQQQEEEVLSNRLGKYQEEKIEISSDYLRSIQDKIYRNRTETAMIPNLIYQMLWRSYQDQMVDAANSFKIDKA